MLQFFIDKEGQKPDQQKKRLGSKLGYQYRCKHGEDIEPALAAVTCFRIRRREMEQRPTNGR